MQKTIPTFTLSINDICKTEKQKAKFRASLKNKTRQIINKEKLSYWIYDTHLRVLQPNYYPNRPTINMQWAAQTRYTV